MNPAIEVNGFFNLPGEGVIVELRLPDGESLLYSRQGLQYRIVDRKQKGHDTAVEETALAQMNVLGTPHGL